MKRTSLERFIFGIILVIIWFSTLVNVRLKDIYHSSLAGKVEKIYFSPRDRSDILVQFENTSKLNQLSSINNKKVYVEKTMLIKGDSIFKQMFTKGYDVYRKVDGEYVLLYHINSEK